MIAAIETPIPLLEACIPEGARVLVLAVVGVGNAGDEAMLGGLLARVRAKYDVTVAGPAPAETARHHGVRTVSPLQALAQVSDYDFLVIGGGSLFSAAMHTGQLIPLYACIAALRGVSVIFVGVGADRSAPRVVRAPLKWLAPRLTALLVRDNASAGVLEEWGIRATVMKDLSFWLPVDESGGADLTLRAAGVRAGLPLVGLSLTAMHTPQRDELLDVIPQLVDANPDLQFLGIPTASFSKRSRRWDDIALLRDLQRRAPRLMLLDEIERPEGLVCIYARCAALVAMRYHAMLLGHRAGVPLLPIPYAAKCQFWLDEVGMRAVELRMPALNSALRGALSGSARGL